MSWSVSGQETIGVEVQGEPTETVRFAASELTRYLERILGAPPRLACAGDGPRIVLEKVGDSDLGEEGYDLSADRGALHIRGGGDAGVLYGVYEFLRRCGGCRFSGLGSDGEHVPRLDRIEFRGGPLRMKPLLWYRGLQVSRAQDLELIIQWVDWMAKNGLNYVLYMPKREGAAGAGSVDPATGERRNADVMTDVWFDRHVAPEVRKRGLKLDMNHHNLFYWLPPDRYFDEHPEWYALIDGKRVAERKQLCVCTSNDEAVDQLIENVREYLRRHPAVKIVGVIPEDGWGMCQCDPCAARDADPNERYADQRNWREGGANRAKSDRYARLLNRVARGIRDEFPEVMVGGAAYIDITLPSERVAYEPNIVIWVALYWRDGAHVISEDSPSQVNRVFHDALVRWRKALPGRLISYSYYMGMNAQKSLPYPMDEIILRSWPIYRSVGVEGATIQCWPSNHEVYSLNLQAFARSGWQETVDPTELLDGYLEGMYGSVADVVRPIFEAFHEAWRRAEQGGPGPLDALPANEHYPCSRGVAITPNGRSIVFLLEVLGEDRLDAILGEAREAAADDRERRQVARLTAAAEYWRRAADVFRIERQAEAARQRGDEEAAKTLHAHAAQETDEVLGRLDPLPAGWMATSTPRSWRSERSRFDSGARGQGD